MMTWRRGATLRRRAVTGGQVLVTRKHGFQVHLAVFGRARMSPARWTGLRLVARCDCRQNKAGTFSTEALQAATEGH